jgi:hypothetical protein
MIKDISKGRPRTEHMKLVAAINNVGMCAHLVKHLNLTLQAAMPVLQNYRKSHTPDTIEGLALDTFAVNAERMTTEIGLAEFYSPDCGEALQAMLKLLPTTERMEG